MKARHKKAAGGSAEPQGKFVDDPTPTETYAGEGSNVERKPRSARRAARFVAMLP